MINNGTLGKILITLNLVRPISNKNNTNPFQDKTNSYSKAYFQIRLNTDKSSRLRVYWADEDERYSQKRSESIRITPKETRYRFLISDLSTIKKLRIDPSEKPAQFRIEYIEISQNGFFPIRIDSEKEFMNLKALQDISNLSIDGNALQFIASGKDSQLEILLNPTIQIYSSIFQRKREESNFSFIANPGGAGAFPSSQIIDRTDIQDGLPLISIVVNKKDLYDKNYGIVVNAGKRGRKWERLSYISYYEDARLRFAAAAGLRIHGGISRWKSKKSYRLYFRNVISRNKFPGVIFSKQRPIPIKRMVVHLDRYQDMPFTTPMAFDIAKRIGSVVPMIKPVKFYLNGRYQGLYWISEHLSKKQWASHIGHENFSFFRFKAKSDLKSRRKYFQFIKRVDGLKSNPSLDKVKQFVDLDNLTRYIITMIFSGDDDWRSQGVAVLDNQLANAKWYWIVWDMDHSFTDHMPGKDKRNHWEKPGLSLVLRDKLSRFDMRQHLFQFLLLENQDYRDYFVKLTMDVLNHLLTNSYLEGRSQYYEKLAVDLKTEHPFNPKMKEFLLNRAVFIRKDLQKQLDLGDIFTCRLIGPEGITFQVDGYPEKNRYQGWYYKNSSINIKVDSPHDQLFSHWLVNGRRINGMILKYIVKQDTDIKAIFKMKSI